MASTATANNPPNRRDPFSISTTHADEQAPKPDFYSSAPPTPYSSPTNYAEISIRAFLLGLTLGSAVLVTLFLAFHANPLWRLPFFLSSLSFFHFLEYQVTALYNPTVATVSAFLLSQNGKAYNIAHSLAFLECFARLAVLPSLDWELSRRLEQYVPKQLLSITAEQPQSSQNLWLALGFIMLAVGQVTRTIAMAKAGSNFNHTVQMKKKQGHVLVTGGIYAWLRHPSYFGFFWWSLGTQVILNNMLCFVGYIFVLWRFFNLRIKGESHCILPISHY